MAVLSRRRLLLSRVPGLFSDTFYGAQLRNDLWTRVDTEAKVSVASDSLVFAGGKATPAWGDPGIIALPTKAITRQEGLTYEYAISMPTAGWAQHGLAGTSALPSAQSVFNNGHGFTHVFAAGNFIHSVGNGGQRSTAFPFVNGSTHYFRVVLKATGALYYVSTDGLTWSLVWDDASLTTGTLYPFFESWSGVFNAPSVKTYMSIVKPAVVSDTFFRADSATTPGNAETGQPWDVLKVGTWGISGNTAYPVAASNDCYTVLNAGYSDFIADIDLFAFAADMFIYFRVGSNKWLRGGVRAGGVVAIIQQWDGSSLTSVGSTAYTPATGDKLRVVAIGSTIKLFVNGNEKVSATNTQNQTTTTVGIGNGVYNAAQRFDNFKVQAA